ncbi:glycosyltransferase [Rhodobacteraceae bacterium CYK-10]|uniref:Glycosyltransferase n=1 Tax=Stagnihabitans tardus TaxID=2699202 RepID=A0AAE5BUI0_9RHOB|nr:glycosyltransferase [Stagnihabitans tardus]
MRLTCIIPAYNEAARLGSVLQAVIGHPLIDEVLVVDDGSSDGTSEVARGYPVRLITLAQNGGKTAALARGFAETASEVVLLIDADLVGLSPAHLTALIAPVKEGRAAMSISLRDNAPGPWRWIGLDYISGERAIRRDLIAGQDEALRRLPKFGFEVFLNGLAIKAGVKIAVVRLPGVVSPLKSAKYGFWAGIWGDVLMMRDLFRAVPPLGLIRQIIAMRRMRV